MADTQTLKSDPFQITSKQLPGLTRSLNFKTVTTFEKDNNNKIIDSSKKTILQYQATPGGIFQAAATSTEGGKAGSWTPINAANSNTPILGQAAINSLQTPKGVLNQETQKSVGIEATKAKLSPEEIKKLSDKTKNQASPTEAGTQSVGGGEAVGPTSPTGGYGGALIYPEDLGATSQDRIKFDMLDDKKKIVGTAFLAIPSGISDTNACNWGENSLNAAQQMAAAVAFKGITKGVGAGVEEVGKSLKKVFGDDKSPTGLAALFAATAVGTDAAALLSRTSGIVLNPNLQLLFNGPTLRPFSFTFKMSAREEGEAEEIRSIIRLFKQGMSPIRTQSSLFLKTPHTFQIEYLHKGKEHKFLNKFKECALTSFSVNYTPEGQYATYTDGAMVSYEMQMQFTELEPIFNDEYPKDNDASIGF